MEKQTSSISSSKYISSTLENVSLNSNISLAQMKELINILDTASYALIVPILKIQNKINSKFSFFMNQCQEMKEKQDGENNDNTTHSEDTKSENQNNNTNPEATKSEKKYEKNIEKMNTFCENVQNNLNLFNELSHSEAYENIIKAFNEIIPDKGMFFETARWYSLGGKHLPKAQNQEEKKEAENDEEKENTDTNAQNDSIKNNNENKSKDKVSSDNSNKKNSSSTSEGANKSHTKNKNKNSTTQSTNGLSLPPLPKWTNKQKKEIDLLKMIQKDHPTNSFIQRISKTFLSRRLFKKIIYQHIFNYYENGTVDDKKVKSSGESTSYKNCKTTFKFSGDKIKNIDKINEMMAKEFKQQFTKIDKENNEYIIAGKIGCQIYELISRIFKRNLLKEFSIVNATLEFYEFYEELINEFNEKEKNVKIIMCDEIVLKQLRQDWKNICLCRDYVSKKKAENAI